jgi:hypothetical protein
VLHFLQFTAMLENTLRHAVASRTTDVHRVRACLSTHTGQEQKTTTFHVRGRAQTATFTRAACANSVLLFQQCNAFQGATSHRVVASQTIHVRPAREPFRDTLIGQTTSVHGRARKATFAQVLISTRVTVAPSSQRCTVMQGSTLCHAEESQTMLVRNAHVTHYQHTRNFQAQEALRMNQAARGCAIMALITRLMAARAGTRAFATKCSCADPGSLSLRFCFSFFCCLLHSFGVTVTVLNGPPTFSSCLTWHKSRPGKCPRRSCIHSSVTVTMTSAKISVSK